MIPNDALYRLLLHSRLHAFLGRSFRFLNPGKELSGAYYVRGLCHALERVARGEVRRLIVEMPPRHSKSTVASIVLPAWILDAGFNRMVIKRNPTQLGPRLHGSARGASAPNWTCRVFVPPPVLV